MRIIDLSSDVCSSELHRPPDGGRTRRAADARDIGRRVQIGWRLGAASFPIAGEGWSGLFPREPDLGFGPDARRAFGLHLQDRDRAFIGFAHVGGQGELGRASCRESVWQYV